MKKYLRTGLFLLVVGGLVALGWWLLKDAHFAVLDPHGQVAAKQKQLLLFTLTLSAVVVVPVFALLAVFAIRYRESNSEAAYRPDWDNNKLLETIWWGIPILIIGVLAVVTWQTSHDLDPYKKIASTTTPVKVQVVALQWKWLFIYPELGVATVNQLPVPVDTPIQFTLTADAPMSAFWVPSLGSQIYAMSGMSSQLNLIANDTGDYSGYANNINGRGYADMTFKVHARTKASFNTWLTEARKTPEIMDESRYKTVAKPAVKKGEFVYRLTDPHMYDTIVGKYMGHSQRTTPNQTSGSTTHESMSMENM